MKIRNVKGNNLPEYFQEYLDGRFANLEFKIEEVKEILIGNGQEGLVKKVIRNEKWIAEFSTKLTVVAAIVGTGAALIFSIVKEVFADFFKIR